MSNRGKILQWTATVNLFPMAFPDQIFRSRCHFLGIWSYSINILILAESDSLETSKSASAVHWEQYHFFFLFMWNPKLCTESDELISVTKCNTLHTRTYSCRTSFYIIMLTWLVSCSELPLRITLKLKNINVLENLKSCQLDEIGDLNSDGPTVSEITA